MRATSLSFLAKQIQVLLTKSQILSPTSFVKTKINEFFNIKNNFFPYQATITIIFLLTSLIIPNDKLFFVISTIFITANFITTKSFVLTALFSIIPLGLFSIGQSYAFQIIEIKSITNDMYPQGRQLTYTITPTLILYFTTFIHFLLLFIKKKIPKFSMIFSFFLTGSFFIILSSVQAEHMRTLSVLYSLGIFFNIVLFLDIYNFLRTKSKNTHKYVFNTLLSQLIICIIFISIIVFLQFLKRNTLGLNIEAIGTIPIFGRGIDENSSQFRPIGLSAHANILAKQVLELLTATITLTLVLFKKKKLLVKKSSIKIAIALAVLVIILTQSRSVYLALLPFIILPVIYLKKETRIFVNELLKFIAKNKLIILTIFFVISLIVPDRFLLSLSTLSTGGLVVRSKLNDLAIKLIANNPILGSGTGTFIPAAFEIDQYHGVMSYFPEYVHNGLLLIAVENGLLSFLFFYFGYYLILKKIRKSKLSKYRYLIYAGFIGQIIPMFFQPFKTLVPLNILLLILLIELDMI